MITPGYRLSANLVQSFADRHDLPTLPPASNFLVMKHDHGTVALPTADCIRHDSERDFAAIPNGQPLSRLQDMHYLPGPCSRSSEENSPTKLTPCVTPEIPEIRETRRPTRGCCIIV